MGKIAKKPLPSAAPEASEDPIWGDALADFFGMRAFGSLSAAAPAVPEEQAGGDEDARPEARRATGSGRRR